MQASNPVLSRRYSRALCEAAKSENQLDVVNKDLQRSYLQLRDKMKFFLHPLIQSAEKTNLIRNILGKKSSPLTVRFLTLLIEKKRFELLSSIVVIFKSIVEEERGEIKAFVKSALKYNSQEKAKQT